MTRLECYNNQVEFGLDGFEGWVECLDNYPDLGEFYGTGFDLPDTVVIDTKVEETPDDQIRPDNQDERKLTDLFYIMMGSIALLILFIILAITRKK